MKNKATVFPVGPKERNVSTRMNILLAAGIIGLAGFCVGEYTGPSIGAEGTVVDKYRSGGKNSSHKIDVQITNGALSGEVVTDTVGSWKYSDFEPGDTVAIDVMKGRFTGLLHGDNSIVIKKNKP